MEFVISSDMRSEIRTVCEEFSISVAKRQLQEALSRKSSFCYRGGNVECPCIICTNCIAGIGIEPLSKYCPV